MIPNMALVIESKQIGKRFGATIALDSISFNVDESDIFGFIGPDGSGKTTLFRLITTLMLPDEGDMEVLGLDIVKDYRELRKHIGYMPGRFSLYQDLTVEENLEFYATVFGTTVKENYHLISGIYSHIEPFKNRLAGKLSGGMKQKLALSCALIHKPKLLILDEPTTGVDAVSRSEFWEMLKKLKDNNITIVVSTPYMDEAMKCDKVALIENGKILAIDKPQKIKESFSKKLYLIKGNEKYRLLIALRDNPETLTAFPFGDSVHVTFRKNRCEDSICEYLNSRGITKVSVIEAEAGIEDRFLELMKTPV
jgi:ABC-2 type transport system ATP-binding protein